MAAACWTTQDETRLLDFLVAHAASAGDGGNFKMVTFTAAAVHVDEKRVRGGPKTAKSCQNKWSALRKVFRAIQAIKGRSGWTWSDETGASITPEMEDAWADFIKVHKDARPFKNKGWVHLEKGMSGMDPFDEDDDDLPPNVLSTQEGSTIADDELVPAQVAVSAPVIPSTPTQASRKHEHATSETPACTMKKAKMLTADAMVGLNSAILQFGDSMCKALTGDSLEKTPHCHTKAMKLAQKEGWLAIGDHLILCNVLEQDIKAADAYLALDEDDIEFCQMWMDRKVAEVKALEASA